MKPAEAQEFHDLLTGVLGFFGKPQPNEIEAEIWWEALSGIELVDIRAALSAHIRHQERGRFAPKPADVIAAISAHVAAKWISADEAWAQALQASDERNTVVWTDEAAKALASASPILAEGDKIGARMAFKQAYERAVHVALIERRAPRPLLSLGWDMQTRVDALESAVSSGLIARDQAEPHLLSARSEITEGGAAIAGLLSGKVIQHPSAPEAVKRRLDDLMNAIKGARDFGADKAKARDAKRKREEEVKSEARKIAARGAA